jgi:hypothetical protein
LAAFILNIDENERYSKYWNQQYDQRAELILESEKNRGSYAAFFNGCSCRTTFGLSLPKTPSVATVTRPTDWIVAKYGADESFG